MGINSSIQESTILIVDDNVINLKALSEYLGNFDFTVLSAKSGEYALDILEDCQPDLILLDVLLPGVDGFEICRRVKEHPETRQIPVIFMSSLSDTGDKIKGFEAGGVDYLTKPLQHEELLARIKAHLTIRNLQQQLQKKNVLLEKINNIVKAINSEIDLEHLLESFLKEAQIIKGVERAAALIYDPLLNAYAYKAAVGLDVDEIANIRISYREAEERYIKNSHEIYEDIFIAEDIQGRVGEEKFSHIGIPRAMLIFRIRNEERVDGYLVFSNMREERAFEDQDIQLLQNLKEHVVSAFIKSRLLAELKEMSLTDPLTGMRNRRYLSKVINDLLTKVHRDYKQHQFQQTGQRPANSDLVFLMLDLDHFKSVNDTYGHDAGDQVLVQLRKVIERNCRDTDILVRWGGEEFLIVSRYSDQHAAQIIAERVREKIEEYPFHISKEQSIHLTCSIGLASYPFMADHPYCLNWEQVVAIADQALYIAKVSGRNAWVNIMSTKHTKPEKLFKRIRYDFDTLTENGELNLITSLF